MAGQPQLFVEGPDDVFAISNLLVKHSVFKKGAKKEDQPVLLVPRKSDSDLLRTAAKEARILSELPTGFVLDADKDLPARWREVSTKILTPLGIVPPSHCPEGGFIDHAPATRNRIGVWLMPDNKTPGALEHLLLDVVPPNSELWDFASKCTEDSLQHGATFLPQSALKARLHCWLAWKESPGEPYGRAIEFEYLGYDSPRVRAFVDWFRQLYAL